MFKTKIIYIFFILFFCFIFTATGQKARREIEENPRRSASNYMAYPVPEEELTPAPKGYKPFYISHYGRHGSRWLINSDEYQKPYQILSEANDSNALTPYGKELLARIEKLYLSSDRRLGELSPLGHRQHRGIAERMYRRFPEIFKGNTAIDAKSTVVIRCILSMTNETQRLAELNPDLRITTDASEHDMHYMNFYDRPLNRLRGGKASEAMDGFEKRHLQPRRLMQALFSDTSYLHRKVPVNDLYYKLFSIAANHQSLDTDYNFDDLFTADERYQMWLCENASWYINYGPSPLTESLMPYSQRYLLQNILDTADTCVVSKNKNVTLRFGHEVCVLPLVCLLELDNAGVIEPDLEKLADKWQNYKIFPMGCNVQLIFYRTKSGKGDVLVKALLNEKEATLPVQSDLAPYYRWKDVEAYYRAKLAKFPEERFKEEHRRK